MRIVFHTCKNGLILFLDRKMYVRRPLYALNILERITGAGNVLLVYLQGQDV